MSGVFSHGKPFAILTLTRMARWLANWRQVWSAYRRNQPLPTLYFRNGLVLHHRPGDNPLVHLHEVFAEREYRRGVRRPPPGLLLDIGANIGAVSLDWAARWPEVRIHAYEPFPPTVEVLRQNLVANRVEGRVRVFAEAVGRTAGAAQAWTDSVSVAVTTTVPAPPGHSGLRAQVPVVSLDDVIARAKGRRVSILKIDTEGAEADILEGASAATLQAVDRMFIEYHETLCANARRRCRDVLTAAGFSCHDQSQVPWISAGVLRAKRRAMSWRP